MGAINTPSSSNSGFFALSHKEKAGACLYLIKRNKGDVMLLTGFLTMGIGLALIFAGSNPELAQVLSGLLLVVLGGLFMCGKSYYHDQDQGYELSTVRRL